MGENVTIFTRTGLQLDLHPVRFHQSATDQFEKMKSFLPPLRKRIEADPGEKFPVNVDEDQDELLQHLSKIRKGRSWWHSSSAFTVRSRRPLRPLWPSDHKTTAFSIMVYCVKKIATWVRERRAVIHNFEGARTWPGSKSLDRDVRTWPRGQELGLKKCDKK